MTFELFLRMLAQTETSEVLLHLQLEYLELEKPAAWPICLARHLVCGPLCALFFVRGMWSMVHCTPSSSVALGFLVHGTPSVWGLCGASFVVQSTIDSWTTLGLWSTERLYSCATLGLWSTAGLYLARHLVCEPLRAFFLPGTWFMVYCAPFFLPYTWVMVYRTPFFLRGTWFMVYCLNDFLRLFPRT